MAASSVAGVTGEWAALWLTPVFVGLYAIVFALIGEVTGAFRQYKSRWEWDRPETQAQLQAQRERDKLLAEEAERAAALRDAHLQEEENRKAAETAQTRALEEQAEKERQRLGRVGRRQALTSQREQYVRERNLLASPSLPDVETLRATAVHQLPSGLSPSFAIDLARGPWRSAYAYTRAAQLELQPEEAFDGDTPVLGEPELTAIGLSSDYTGAPDQRSEAEKQQERMASLARYRRTVRAADALVSAVSTRIEELDSRIAAIDEEMTSSSEQIGDPES